MCGFSNFVQNCRADMKNNPVFAFLLAVACTISLPVAHAQEALPPSFLLGEDESAYEKLCEAHPRTLIGVSNNDIDAALKNWFGLVKSIEAYAGSVNFKVDGLRVWLHVFWNTDGKIDHIGFFLMPNSRFFKEEELKALLSGFIRQYKPVLNSDRPFSHYTSASFPVLSAKK
jgi:hypothetical protein